MIERKQKPPIFKDYRRYKPFLRLDFEFRCAYCTITEYRWGSDRNFVVEHFRPRVQFAHLTCTYSNLYYACNRCNDFKSDTWPSDEEIAHGHGWADPCTSEVYEEHFRELKSGILQPRTRIGEYTAENLLLNLRPYLVTWRFERRQLLDEIDASLKLVKRLEKERWPRTGSGERKQLERLIATHKRLCERLRMEY